MASIKSRDFTLEPLPYSTSAQPGPAIAAMSASKRRRISISVRVR